MAETTPLDKNDPRLVSWQAYKALPSYASTRRWALDPHHVDGSLWAAFYAGWEAAAPSPPDPLPGCGVGGVEERIAGPTVAVPVKIVERLRAYRASQPYDPVLSQIEIDMNIALSSPAALSAAPAQEGR